MKILITSGGTSEKIDQVRSITNHSTGTLGKIIANTFLENNDQVTLVTTKKAVKPSPHDNLTIQHIENVSELLEIMEPLVKSHDVLIHSMAVSDYQPIYMTGFDQVENSTNLKEFLTKNNQYGKISSNDVYQVLFLKKNPKIIAKIKEWNPDIRLIGFKLLVEASKKELLEVARDSLMKNQADMIIANDLADILDEKHHAYLVKQDSETEAFNKKDIAQKIFEHIYIKET